MKLLDGFFQIYLNESKFHGVEQLYLDKSDKTIITD